MSHSKKENGNAKVKIKKGDYGYLKAHRKSVILRTLLYFGISIAVFILGWVSSKTKANLMTVIAMLGMLPASKSLVEVILFLRAKDCSEDIYRQTKEHAGDLPMAYELLLTSYEQNYPISSIACISNIVCGYAEDPKCDVVAAKKHIMGILKQNAFKPGIEIYKEFTTYLNRLDALTKMEPDPDTIDHSDEILNIIKAISIGS
ncbi:MAG: hypothetical protein RRX92_07255 [Lachnospiraceae bacterium]